MMVANEKRMSLEKTKPDPAYQIIYHLRTYTDRVRCRRDTSSSRREQVEKIQMELQEAHENLSTLDTPGSANALLIVAWLQDCCRKNSINTLHNKFDDVIAFLKLIGHRPIEDALRETRRDALYPPQRDPAKLGRYFSTLRSLYQFVSRTQRWQDLPDGLKYRTSQQLTEERVLTLRTLVNLMRKIRQATISIPQHPYTEIPVADYLVAMVLICSFSALRISEVLRLSLGDIWVTDRLTVTVLRKRGKQITTEIPRDLTPVWVLNFLREFWDWRYRELDGNLGGRLLVGALFSSEKNPGGADDGRAYYRLKAFFERIDFADGFHIMRRYFANQARLRGVPLLQIINILGHSTTTTAPRSYIQVFPILQYMQLRSWVEGQARLIFPDVLEIRNLARVLGISREGAFRMIQRAKTSGGISHRGGRSAPICLPDVIQVIAHTISMIITVPES
ncbi:site-specific integrase [Candidatus Parcubacteria bacterium]|nr:MAG: site-specific integrase [Candidatus Parcubacteria bacterium]